MKAVLKYPETKVYCGAYLAHTHIRLSPEENFGHREINYYVLLSRLPWHILDILWTHFMSRFECQELGRSISPTPFSLFCFCSSFEHAVGVGIRTACIVFVTFDGGRRGCDGG